MKRTHQEELMLDELELVQYRAGQLGMSLDIAQQIREGAWTGSMGGHDPDFEKLKNGLPTWWREKAATDPHPFQYCVDHLSKKFPNPQRLCAWLKDQALGTTKWRNAEVKEGDPTPTDPDGDGDNDTCDFCAQPATGSVNTAAGAMNACPIHMAYAQTHAAVHAKHKKRKLREADIWIPSREDFIGLAKMFASDFPEDKVMQGLLEAAERMEDPEGDSGTPDPATETSPEGEVEPGGEGTRAGEPEGETKETAEGSEGEEEPAEGDGSGDGEEPKE